jgi:hypothetical protein
VKPKNDLERLTLDTISEAIEEHGADGVTRALDLLKRVEKNGELTREDTRMLGLRRSSDLLAAMQEAEAADRKAALDMATKIGSVLGPVLKAIVVSLI